VVDGAFAGQGTVDHPSLGSRDSRRSPFPTSKSWPVPDLTSIVFDDRGLVPAVVQQHDTGEVLMVAWMDRATLEETLTRGETVFWSRSRRERWHKGATSGDTQRVVEIRVDCDDDVLLVLVDQRGRGACHTGERSCFGRRLEPVEVGGTSSAPTSSDPAPPAATPPAPPLWSTPHPEEPTP
jgi:phosphoribosyl-AMP cyclohydrolase